MATASWMDSGMAPPFLSPSTHLFYACILYIHNQESIPHDGSPCKATADRP